jgi:hypothetical protein
VTARNPVADTLWGTLSSPNEADSNFEAANVVDGLFAIARAIQWAARVYAAVHDKGPWPSGFEEDPR